MKRKVAAKQDHSILKGIAVGSLVSVLMLLLMTGLYSYMVVEDVIDGKYVRILHIICVFAGCLIASIIGKRAFLKSNVIVTVIYFAILIVINVLVSDAKIRSIPINAGMIVAGMAAAFLINSMVHKRGGTLPYKHRW